MTNKEVPSLRSVVQRFAVNMTGRTPSPDEEEENKVMDSSIQRWLTGLDSLSTIKGRDLDIHRFIGNVDISDRKLLDSEPCRSEMAN